MIIAVCLKQISYLYTRSGADAATQFVRPGDYVRMNNPLDEAALEAAVRIKEIGRAAEVWVVCLGAEFVEGEARRAIAIGADRFVRLDDPAWGEVDAISASLVLGAAIKRIGAQTVICGARSADMGRGEIGRYVAARLGFPYLSKVIDLKVPPDDQYWLARRGLGRGYVEEVKCKPPVVVAVERSLCEPRYPARRERLKAEDKEISVWGAQDLGLVAHDMDPLLGTGAILSPRPAPKFIAVPDAALPARERISALLSARTTSKQGRLVEGRPEALAAEMMKFLTDKGMLK
jgi:electron transfer flavoprotein beta subunit